VAKDLAFKLKLKWFKNEGSTPNQAGPSFPKKVLKSPARHIKSRYFIMISRLHVDLGLWL
jgi:hypothetical protein